MIYVYDTIVTKETKKLHRYGATYKLEQKFRMGTRQFYSYICPGMEKILVVPAFAEMYREAERIISKFGKGKNEDQYLELIQKHVSRFVTAEEFPNDESETGIMMVYTVEYKDIRVGFEYMNHELKIANEFEIRDNNIFGNGIVVSMNLDEEEDEEDDE
ncbi:MAG: hypothetical protein MJ101_01655 [Clostridia bacterium]|nr:hypothetical protein [Clostridia bacterium]